MSTQKAKRPRMSSSSDRTDSDARKHQGPASGDTESPRNAGIEQTQENPDCSRIASDGRPDVEKIDVKRMCLLSSQEFIDIQKTILFADKTESIFDVFHADTRVLHLFAPRRFGKTTFLDTIHACMSIQINDKNEAKQNREDSEIYKLFMSLELGKKHAKFVEQNCGLYPVIRLSFENVGGRDITRIEESLKCAVCEAFEDHKYLVKLDTNKGWEWRNPKLLEKGKEVETFLKYILESRINELTILDVTEGLLNLATLLHIHHKQKVVILIDECDTPIMKLVKKGESDEIIKDVIELIGDVLKITLKGKATEQHIKLGVLTSCTRMSGIFSWELNNTSEFYFLHDNKFSKVFGFTEQEVRKMMSDPELKSICEKAHINQFDAITDMDTIDDWYDGYRPLHDEKTSIYCSYSLLNYTKKSIEANTPKLAAYWAGGGYLTTLGTLFAKEKIREPIQQLLEGETYDIRVVKVTTKNILGLRDTMFAQREPTYEEVDFFLQLLSDDGILNTIGEYEGKAASLIIPNYENKMMIEHHCYTANIFTDVYRIKPENIATYINTLKFLLRQPGKETCRQFANAVSMLYSGDAQMPANETEFNAHLYNLARIHLHINAEEFMEEEEPEPGPASKSPAGHNLDRKSKPKLEPDLMCRSKRGWKKEFDILITIGTAGVIFELKYGAQSAQKALQQINEKQYFKAFDKKEHTGVKRKLYVGLHMDKKKKVTLCALLNGLRGEIVQVSSDDKK